MAAFYYSSPTTAPTTIEVDMSWDYAPTQATYRERYQPEMEGGEVEFEPGPAATPPTFPRQRYKIVSHPRMDRQVVILAAHSVRGMRRHLGGANREQRL